MSADVDAITTHAFRKQQRDLLNAAHAGRVIRLRRYDDPIATVVAPDLLEELIEAAGERGQQIVDQYERRASEHQEAVPA